MKLPGWLLWLTFLACMFAGAGLLFAGRTGWGVALILLPALGAMALALAHYWAQRRQAKAGP